MPGNIFGGGTRNGSSSRVAEDFLGIIGIDEPFVGEYGPLPLPDFAVSESDLAPNSADIVSDEGVFDLEQSILNSIQAQNEASQTSADRAMEFSAEQAQLNRDFQERMSNTAYQRAMADLEAAGINPKLVAKLGGASTPSGSSASGTSANMQAANFAPIATVLSSYITSAASLENKDKDFVQNILTSLIRVLPYAAMFA